MQTNLTPPDQREAALELHPLCATADAHHYEYEGYDWQELAHLITEL